MENTTTINNTATTVNTENSNPAATAYNKPANFEDEVKKAREELYKGLDENTRHCKTIADVIEAYANGRVFRCPDCGEIVTIDNDVDINDIEICPECGAELEQLTVWDYFDDYYNIEYRCDNYKEYTSVEIMIACGGPNIYVDTAEKAVKLYWWTESAKWCLTSNTCEQIDEMFKELFDSI